MDMRVDGEIFQYEAYRNLSGAVQTVTLGRRNGRTAACFGPSFFPSELFEEPEPEPAVAPEERSERPNAGYLFGFPTD